jgi:hypothetical protein
MSVMTAVPERWHVLGSGSPRPEAERVIYADGSAGREFRSGVDLELSHWVPTTTPDRWLADSSTETCLRFVVDPPDDHYDLVVNNHLDVDGILALFSLVRSPLALAHREAVIGAAEMGDFAAGVDRPAFRLAQELTLLIEHARTSGADTGRTYGRAFELTERVLDGTAPEPEAVSRGWMQLEHGGDRIADATVQVEVLGDHFVSYVLPRLGGADLESALRVPLHNARVDESVWLWPHTRNRDHGQAMHLVSVPASDGFFHDLWLPGYMWANTPNRWRAPGLTSTGDSNAWILHHPRLSEQVAELGRRERNAGSWVLATDLTPFQSLPGRNFPIVLSFMDEHRHPGVSSIVPSVVADVLLPALTAN